MRFLLMFFLLTSTVCFAQTDQDLQNYLKIRGGDVTYKGDTMINIDGQEFKFKSYLVKISLKYPVQSQEDENLGKVSYEKGNVFFEILTTTDQNGFMYQNLLKASKDKDSGDVAKDLNLVRYNLEEDVEYYVSTAPVLLTTKQSQTEGPDSYIVFCYENKVCKIRAINHKYALDWGMDIRRNFLLGHVSLNVKNEYKAYKDIQWNRVWWGRVKKERWY